MAGPDDKGRSAGPIHPRRGADKTVIRMLVLAIRQLPDPRFRRVLMLGLGAAFVVFAALFALAVWLIGSTQIFEQTWLEYLTDALGGLAALIFAVLVFPGIVGIVVGLFIEDAIRAVEERHYPELGPPRRQNLRETLGVAVRFGLITVLMNLLALPVYAATFIVPLLAPTLYYAMNGYLLGREYYEMVALRRLDPETAAELRRTHRRRLFLAGVIVAFGFSIPVVNLAMPLVAAAFMVHLLRDLQSRDRSV